MACGVPRTLADKTSTVRRQRQLWDDKRVVRSVGGCCEEARFNFADRRAVFRCPVSMSEAYNARQRRLVNNSPNLKRTSAGSDEGMTVTRRDDGASSQLLLGLAFPGARRDSHLWADGLAMHGGSAILRAIIHDDCFIAICFLGEQNERHQRDMSTAATRLRLSACYARRCMAVMM